MQITFQTLIPLFKNVLDAIIDKKLMQVKPRSYWPFFTMKHEKWIARKELGFIEFCKN